MIRSPEWLAIYHELSLPEQRRADRAIPPVLDRHPHETIYPTTGWIGEYLLYCQEMEAPLGWHFWAAVVLLGLVARRNFYIDRGVYFLYLNHYVLILGPSGLTKSTTIGRLQGVFNQLTKRAGGEMKAEHIWVSPDRITQQKLTTELTGWAKDQTRKDSILFMVNDELATLAGKNVRGADVLIDFLTACYAKDNYKDSTIVGGERELRNAAISCLFGTTPSSMRRNMTESLFTEGFMGRTITVHRDYPDRRGVYPRPPPVDPVAGRLLAYQLEPWLLIDRAVEVVPTTEADEWMDEWYENHIAAIPDDEKLVAFWRRKQDHAYKLAGVLAMSEQIRHGVGRVGNELVVTLDTLRLALRLLEDEERRLSAAFNAIGAREEAQDIYRLQAYIEKRYAETGEPVPHRSIAQNCRHFIKSTAHLEEMEKTLMAMGVIEILGTGGRMFVPKEKK